VMGMLAIDVLQCIVLNKMVHVGIVFPEDELSCTCATSRWHARTLMLSKVPVEIDLSVIVACKNNHIILQKAAAYTTAGRQSTRTRRKKMEQLPDY